MAPFVSVIVNCFNQGHYLERSVKSVLSQTFTDLECLIVDDGSTDNTRQVAENLISQDQRVHYFFKQNSGLPSSRNFGMQQAQGEWIQYLDADDWIHEDKIRFQLEYIPLAPAQDIVLYADYERVFIGANEEILERQENIIGSLTSAELTQRLLIPDFLADSPHPALQQAMLIHKSLLNKIKFPENLKALGDRYFGIDILMSGANFIYTPIIGAYYTKHKSNRTNNWNYMKQYYIAFYEFVSLNYPKLNKLCQIGLDFLIDEAIREREQENFARLSKIVPMPVHILGKNLKVNNKSSLRLLYSLISRTPRFLLYEKYRGPRSQKVLRFFNAEGR